MTVKAVFRKLHSAVSLIKVIKNWGPALADHAGLTRKRYTCVLRSGLRFLVRGRTDDGVVLFEIFAKKHYSPAKLYSGATVIDIGANIGCFTVLAAQTAAKVVACEPHPGNRLILAENLALNRTTNVEIIPHAIAGKAGNAALIIPDNPTFVGRYSLHPGKGSRSINVSCITLQGLFREAGLMNVDLIKLDCEGAEYEILYSSAETLMQVRQIIAECTQHLDHPGCSQSELADFLSSLGFSVTCQAKILYASKV